MPTEPESQDNKDAKEIVRVPAMDEDDFGDEHYRRRDDDLGYALMERGRSDIFGSGDLSGRYPDIFDENGKRKNPRVRFLTPEEISEMFKQDREQGKLFRTK